MFKHGFMHELADLLKTKEETYILLIDVIGFIKFNEDYGFRMGDKALQEAINRISMHTTEDMTLISLAGDEWIIFTNFKKNVEAEKIAEQILQYNNNKVKYCGIEAPLQLRIAIINTDLIEYRNSIFAAKEIDVYMNQLKTSTDFLLNSKK